MWSAATERLILIAGLSGSGGALLESCCQRGVDLTNQSRNFRTGNAIVTEVGGDDLRGQSNRTDAVFSAISGLMAQE